jgi:hypothetical protein
MNRPLDGSIVLEFVHYMRGCAELQHKLFRESAVRIYSLR